MNKFLILLYKIFFVGLLLQFVAFNFVTYQLGLSGGAIEFLWLWKEAIIGLLLMVVILQMIAHHQRALTLWPGRRGKWQLLLIVLIVLTAGVDLAIHHQSIGTYAMALKYDLFGFIIFFVGLHSSRGLSSEERQQLMMWFGKVCKRILGAALVWYLIIAIKPGTLKLLGYDNYVFEGTVGYQPPAAYYTEINQGITRNQFLFERPVSRGFFLTAFWPLFFLLFLYKQPLSNTWGWWGIYGLNIFLTFSRAARGSWLILCFLIGLSVFWHERKKLLGFVVAPILTLMAVFFALGGANLLTRGFSDTGHVTMVLQGWNMMLDKPVRGRGGTMVGPGSHHDGGMAYNPENQFLQIRIEYGSLVFLLWVLLFLGLAYQSRYNKQADYGQAFALGMCGLAISGMVLHSFSDRMIVYPFMLLWGIWIASTLQSETASNSGK